MTSVKKKALFVGMTSKDIASRKSELEKELVRYRLSLDAGSISVTGGYPALMKEIKHLSRACAKSLSEGGK